MRTSLRLAPALLVLLGLNIVPARAEGSAAPAAPTPGAAPLRSSAPLTIEEIQKAYQKFDPRAVSAARHYYESPAMRDATSVALKGLTAGMAKVMEQANPGLSPQNREAATTIVFEAVSAQLERLRAMNVLNALQTFTTDELVALDNFYSSPTGSAVVAKLPQLTARLPTMIQAILPDMQEYIRAKARAKGMELKI